MHDLDWRVAAALAGPAGRTGAGHDPEDVLRRLRERVRRCLRDPDGTGLAACTTA